MAGDSRWTGSPGRIIVFLISLASRVGSFFDLSDPLHARIRDFGQREPSLASFESYKINMLKSPQPGSEQASKAADLPDGQTVRAVYEPAKFDKIPSVRLQAPRSVTVLRLLLLHLLHFAQADCDEESLGLAGARQLKQTPGFAEVQTWLVHGLSQN
jgi:hypothetical protein